MIRFIGRRLALAVPTVVLVTFLVFVLMAFSPTDAAAVIAGDNPTPERLAEIRQQLGEDQPFFQRYLNWGLAALSGDLGTSPVTHQEVLPTLIGKLSISLSLILLAIIFTLMISITLGTVAALNRGGAIDWICNAIANISMAIPPFVAAIWLVLVFVPPLPATGFATVGTGLGEWLRFTTLPALSLAFIPAALMTRQIRGALIDALEEDYVRTARAKGLRRLAVVGKHAAKNAALPVVTVFGLVVASMVGGSVVVERIFAIPGIGGASVQAVLTGDLVTLQGVVVIVALLVTIINLAVDASYGFFNPRLRTR